MAEQNRVAIDISAQGQEQTRRALSDIGAGSKAMGNEFAGAAQSSQVFSRALITLGTTMATYFGVQFFKNAVTGFAEFEKGLSDISILLNGDVGPTMQKFKKEVEDLSVDLGLATGELTKSLFDTQSATGDTAKALEYLRAGAELAVAGNSNLKDTISGVLTLMENYSDQVNGVTDATDLMMKAQKLARADIGQVAKASQEFLPLGALLKLNIEELYAAYAQMTLSLGDAQRAGVALMAVERTLLKPSKELTDQMKAWFGMTAQQAAETYGLNAIIEKLSTLTTEQVSKLNLESEALKGIAILTASVNEQKEKTVELTSRQNEVQDKLNIQMETTKKRLDKSTESWHLMNRAIGEFVVEATPAVSWMERVAESMRDIANLSEKNKKEGFFKNFFVNIPTDIGEELGSALVSFFDKFKTASQQEMQEFGDMQREYAQTVIAEREGILTTGIDIARDIQEQINEERADLYEEDMEALAEVEQAKAEQSLEYWKQTHNDFYAFIQEFSAQTKKTVEENTKIAKKSSDIITGQIGTLSENVGSAFGNMIMHGENFGEAMQKAFKDMGATFIAEVTSMMVKWLAFTALQGVLAFFSAGTSAAGSGGIASVMVGTMHKGGRVGSNRGPVRAHEGLAADEVPIIAQAGEGIVSKKGMEALDMLNRGVNPTGESGASYTISINIEQALMNSEQDINDLADKLLYLMESRRRGKV